MYNHNKTQDEKTKQKNEKDEKDENQETELQKRHHERLKKFEKNLKAPRVLCDYKQLQNGDWGAIIKQEYAVNAVLRGSVKKKNGETHSKTIKIIWSAPDISIAKIVPEGTTITAQPKPRESEEET